MKKINIITALCIAGNFLFTTIAISQNVNEFTGGFSYSVPLITVPSPYGPGVSIGAGYGAGIGVNQSASEIGLGWDINLGGVISRNVSGVPDDWNNVVVADPTNAGFKTQAGVMHLNTKSDNLDYYKSTYKIDTSEFHFPDYDSYSVSGPGIGGTLKPHLFDFTTTKMNVVYNVNVPATKYVVDDAHNFKRTVRFNFGEDYAGNFKSRHYPSTPINGSTTLRYPGYNDVVTDAEYTTPGKTTPYVGVGLVGFDTLTNRLATAKYVEYTNDAGGFKITDEAGFVYNYTIPVYVNSVTYGNYPLNNNYTPKVYNGTADTLRVTDANGNYYIKDSALSMANGNRPFMIEWKQNAAYVYNWLLTSVTGPDYVDVNSNGVDDLDKGYWVTYDWQKWTSNFIKRIPEYGFNYSFSADEYDNTQDLTTTYTAKKISGKYGTFTKYDQEVYYLNKVHTASHTAVMVRDVRLDAYCSQPYNYDNQNVFTSNMPTGSGTATKTSNYGTLYDDGGPTGSYTGNCTSKVTITPSGASSITIRFNSLTTYNGSDVVKILDPSNGDAVLATYPDFGTYPTTGFPLSGATFAKTSIKVQEFTDNDGHVAAGFRLSWSSTVHPTVTPQLKLTRIVLFKNEDYTTLNTVASNSAYNVSTAEAGFSLPTTGKTLFYNETWYNHINNKAAIESKSLQTVEFNQDYSLTRRFPGNVKTTVCATDKLSPPSDVANGITVPSANYASSGKLTLNEILTYDVGHVKTVPSVLFDYNKSIGYDNPNYNPIKIDYAGFYKSDASAQGYSSYTTSVSKDSTDAWSLRKITSPMGGTTEITYESNQYEKVLDGKGGFRGPSKMYMIKSITVPADSLASKWNYTLEEDITTPSDFTDLKNSTYTTVKHCFIPFIDTLYNGAFWKYINSDTCKLYGFTMTRIRNFYAATIPVTAPPGQDYFLQDPTSWSIFTAPSNLKYTGNGYIHFDIPIGTAVYGGGIRVKTLVVKNGTTDAYTKEYTYSGGVTPMEFDRFAEEKKLVASSTHHAHYVKLRPAQYDYHRMGPGIGYTSVTVKNKGQNNISNGSSTTTFVTSDAGIANFKVSPIQLSSAANSHCNCAGNCMPQCDPGTCNAYLDTTYIIEVVDKFGGYWGQVKETQTADMNDNILSRTVNTYANLDQGSIVENYDFLTIKDHVVSQGGGATTTCSQYDRTICIKRQYPVILSKQTTYTQGISAVTEYLTFDQITGSPTQVRTTSPNKGITVTRSAPAFRNSQYSVMGPKSVTSTNANILSPTYYSRTTVDSTITNKSDFGNYTVQTFKKNFDMRMYSVPRAKFIDSARTNLYWIADKSYGWAGDSTSLSNYGLFKQSNFTAFDYTLASINKKWRLGTDNTILDNSGHVLETKGFNNRFNATKYGYGDTLQIAQAGNVNYASFTFSSFESAVKDLDPGAPVVNYIDGEVKMNNGLKSAAVTAHTGNYVMKVPVSTTGASAPTYSIKYISGTNENQGLMKNRTYRASVWVYSASPSTAQLSVSFTGITTQSIAKSNAANVTIGNWTLMNVDITVPASPSNNNELKVYLENPDASVIAYFDDLRLHPVDASMTSTVYDIKTNRVTATLDGNNFATKYIYDAGGRVIEVWQEIEGLGLKRMKKTQYNYARGLQ